MKRRYLAFLVILSLATVALVSCKEEVREGDTVWNNAVAPFRKTLDMGGYTLQYIDMGEGEPVVLVHGFADSSYSWHENAHALEGGGNRLIMVDQPGFGLSDAPPDPYVFSVDNQARAVVTLTEILGLKDFSIVGHCMGGSIALFIARNHPEKIRKIALIDPIPYKPPAIQLLKLPGAEFIAANYGGHFTVRMGLEDAFYDSDRVNETMVNEYSRSMNRPGYVKTLVSMQKQFYSPAFYAAAREYEKIRRPALIIWGKEDTWVTPDAGKRLNASISGSELRILEKCGHNPHQECKETVNPLLVEFLSDAAPRLAPHLIRPGTGVGEITLGMSREEVNRHAGRPVLSMKAGDQYEGFIIRYAGGLASEILVTSSAFRTREGVSTGTGMEKFLAAYPDAARICYEAKSVGHVSRGVIRDALAQGIAYDWNVYEGKRREEFVTITIHKPGTPAHVFGTPSPCRGEGADVK
jgi:2-hydroxy-6-oxonona-2,4-dienedioate hydrolase